MRIRIYQISTETDKYNLMFMNWDFALKKCGHIRENTYELVYEGDVEAKNLEDLYTIFNRHLPSDYRGRSMSVSDIVEIIGDGFYFCDSFGFVRLDFDGTKCKRRVYDE